MLVIVLWLDYDKSRNIMSSPEAIISIEQTPHFQDSPESVHKRAHVAVGALVQSDYIDQIEPVMSEIDDDTPEILSGIHLTDDAVRDYFVQIIKYPLLKPHEEAPIAKAIEIGVLASERYEDQQERLNPEQLRELQQLIKEGEKAKQKMLNSNLRLVVSIAKRYKVGGLQLLDLIQEGNLGLVHAVEMFDHTKGYKFSTYATGWIRQAVLRAIDNTSRDIRVPVHTSELMRKITKTEQVMLLDLGRAPTEEELALELDISTEKLKVLRGAMHTSVSLNMRLSDESDAVEFGDIIQDDQIPEPTQGLEAESLVADVHALIARLPEREARVIRMRTGIETGEVMRLDIVGEHLGITRQRVQQIERAARQKLALYAEAHKQKLMIHITE
jgi:RNA polymerase primary sigma factor